MVLMLTRDGEKTYLEWIQSIADSGNRGAIKVKMADNTHNMDQSRGNPPGGDMKSLFKRYEKSLKILGDAL